MLLVVRIWSMTIYVCLRIFTTWCNGLTTEPFTSSTPTDTIVLLFERMLAICASIVIVRLKFSSATEKFLIHIIPVNNHIHLLSCLRLLTMPLHISRTRHVNPSPASSSNGSRTSNHVMSDPFTARYITTTYHCLHYILRSDNWLCVYVFNKMRTLPHATTAFVNGRECITSP